MVIDSSSNPASTSTVPTIAALSVDTLQVPERTGIFSADTFLGATTPSDVSSANSPAMSPAAASKPADAVIESFSLAAEANAAARAPVSLLPPDDEDEDDDDDDDGFIPRGGTTYPSVTGGGRPPAGPKAVNKPPKPSGGK